MQKIRLSEDCLLFHGLQPGVAPAAVARLVEELPTGCIEVVGAFESIGLYGEVDEVAWECAVLDAIQDSSKLSRRVHELPVCFELGLDTREVCQRLLLDVDQLSKLICDQAYTCFAIGFVPGFPYCSGLPSILENLERRSTPRARVPSGSVAIASGQLGIYPAEVPGGWNLIGRTPLQIADEGTDFFPISPGDALKLTRIGEAEFNQMVGKKL